jgi:hypothetical protein
LRAEIRFDEPEKVAALERIGLDTLKAEVEWLKDSLANEDYGVTRAKDVSCPRTWIGSNYSRSRS